MGKDSVQTTSEHNSEYTGQIGDERSTTQMISKQLRSHMNLDEIQEQEKMFDHLYKTFYEPYFSAAVKCGDVDTAINSLFVGCFVQPEAEQIY